jgi:dolichol-phosphate mannosyltransferase
MRSQAVEPTSKNERKGIKLGVVIPLANEAESIRRLLTGVLIHLHEEDRVYCVLDQVSKDETRSIVSDMADRDARVILVWTPENRCVVDAYVRGYQAALDDDCDWILEMDGGFSHLPEEIPQFLDAMEQGYDFVGGSRFMPGGSHRSPWSRVVVSKGGSVFTNLLLKTKMTDMTSGFECFRRHALQEVLARGIVSKANFFQTEIRYLMHQFRWREVPISYRNQKAGMGWTCLREAFNVLWGMRREQRNSRA